MFEQVKLYATNSKENNVNNYIFVQLINLPVTAINFFGNTENLNIARQRNLSVSYKV